MNQLLWTLKQLHAKDRSGSEQTRANRWTMLKQMTQTLDDNGYKRLHASGLKPRHVDCLIQGWLNDTSPRTGKPLSPATVKNRIAVVRWWAHQVGKPNIVPRSNDALGVPRRIYATNENKAERLTATQLDAVRCRYVRLSLQLQAEFGLRREEAMKFTPSLADKGDHVHLLGSWCKGGRPRSIPVVSDRQRQLLDEAARTAPNGSLIPAKQTYVEHLQTWTRETQRIGLPRTHGLRHRYAQVRYRTLTDREPPNCGGSPRHALETRAQRARDLTARRLIAEELGHSRIAITNNYLGR